MFKKYTLRQMQLLYNAVFVMNGDFKNNYNIDFLIAQAMEILERKDDIEKMSDEEKANFKIKMLEEINKILEKYMKIKEKKGNMDILSICYEGKTYFSNCINLRTYFFINDNFKNSDITKMSEDVLYMIYEGILEPEKIEEIKDDDPIYWEIITEDVRNLILKTLKEISEIKTYRRPDCIKKSGKKFFEDEEGSEEIELYASMLENYGVTPEQLNKSKASDILAAISLMSNKQILREVEEKAQDIQGDDMYRSAFIYQIKKQLKGER